VRSTLAWVTILIFAGLGVFGWQRSQIVHLRAQVARQGDALEDNQRRVEDLSQLVEAASGRGTDAPAWPAVLRARKPDRPDENSAALRADERRVILDQYRDVLSEMNLPPETASRLQDLLTERIETVLDAEDAAVRVGFAEGSAETARAVTLAVADVDRDIANLVGADGIRRIDGLPETPAPEPSVVVVQPPAPAPTVVTVVVQSPGAPSYYADADTAPAVSSVSPAYAPYFYYPFAGFINAPRTFRSFGGARGAIGREHHEFTRFSIR
jgi:uncharacterized protein (UPF0335 family)